MADSNKPSTKVTVATLGGALATILWILMSETFLEGVFTAGALTALTGGTATVFAFVLAYFIPNPS